MSAGDLVGASPLASGYFDDEPTIEAMNSLKLDLTRWILWDEPAKRPARRAMLRASGLPFAEANSMRELNALYEAWGLRR